MKRLIITEEEKHKIMSLYEKVGEKLPTDRLGSKKGEITKRIAKQLNGYYKINLTFFSVYTINPILICPNQIPSEINQL